MKIDRKMNGSRDPFCVRKAMHFFQYFGIDNYVENQRIRKEEESDFKNDQSRKRM